MVYLGLDVHGSNDNYPYPETDGESGAVIVRSAAEIQRERDEEVARKAADYVDALRSDTMTFSGQVALVHGDSHYFKIDKPINLPSGGVLANFTRVETFGARQTHWVRATVDPRDPNLFEFSPQIVPANVG